jgi:hypothetical protein
MAEQPILTQDEIDELEKCADYNIIVGLIYEGLTSLTAASLPALAEKGCVHHLKGKGYVLTDVGAGYLLRYAMSMDNPVLLNKMTWYQEQFPKMKAELEQDGDW